MAFIGRARSRQQKQATEHISDAIRIIANTFVTTHSSEATLRQILRSCAAYLQSPLELAAIVTFDPKTGDLTHVYAQGNTTQASSQILLNSLKQAVERKQPAIIDGTTRGSVFAFAGARSAIVAPMILGDACYGAIICEHLRAHAFPPDALRGMQLFADFAALAARELDEFPLVLAPENQAPVSDRLDQILDDILALMPDKGGVMAEILAKIPGTQEVITLRLRPDDSVALPIRLRKQEGIIGQVITSGQPFVGNVTAYQGNAQGIGSSGDITHLHATQSILVMPLKVHNVLLGILNIESPLSDACTAALYARVAQSEASRTLIRELEHLAPETITSQHIVDDLLEKFRQQVAVATSSGDVSGLYYQILQVATQITETANVSGAIFLLRDESQTLTSVPANSASAWVVQASRIGEFDSDLEWPLSDRRVTSRAIEEKTIVNVPSVQSDPDYKTSGKALEQGSEIVVPLLDDDRPIGVLILASPQEGAFNEEDEARLWRLARYSVVAIKHSDMLLDGQRAKQQLRCALEVLQGLEPLYPKDVRQLDKATIESVQKRLLEQLLDWTCQYTESRLGAVVLLEDRNAVKKMLEIKIMRDDQGGTLPTAKQRWPVTEGATGQAIREERTINIPDVDEVRRQQQQTDQEGEGYFDYFPDVKSNLAVPLRRGKEIIGALDIESDRRHHFTNAYVSWVEFLAQQIAFVLTAIDLAKKTFLETRLQVMSERLDDHIADMRTVLDMPALREVRNNALDELLQETIRTIAEEEKPSLARILFAVNAYSADGSLDFARGRLIYLASTYPGEINHPPFSIAGGTGRGVSGIVFQSGQMRVFNHGSSRPREFFVRSALSVGSGIFLPIFEGSLITGVLDIESEAEGVFTPEVISALQTVGDMISRTMSAARLRLRRLQSDKLRQFELEILQNTIVNIDMFMGQSLNNAAILSSIQQGWGEVVLTRRTTDRMSVLIDQTFTGDIRDGLVTLQPAESSHQHAPVQSPIFREILTTMQPLLILNTGEETIDTLAIPWPDAKSLICVPLLRPSEESKRRQDNLDEEVVGFLTLASPVVGEFSDADKEILPLYAQTIVNGLNNIALLNARKALLDEIMHDITKGSVPLGALQYRLEEPLARIREAPDLITAQQEAHEIGASLAKVKDLIGMFSNLLFWYRDLADEELRPAYDASIGLDVMADVIGEMQSPIDVLADVVRKVHVTWPDPAVKLYVAGGEKRAQLIIAVLFKFLDNAIKHSDKEGEVNVDVAFDSLTNEVIFSVTNTGVIIPEADRKLLFQLHFRGANAVGLGSGIGLYQARHIAERLDGHVAYQTDEVARNTFILALPAIPPPTIRRGT